MDHGLQAKREKELDDALSFLGAIEAYIPNRVGEPSSTPTEVLEGRAASLQHLALSSFGSITAAACKFKAHPGIPPCTRGLRSRP